MLAEPIDRAGCLFASARRYLRGLMNDIAAATAIRTSPPLRAQDARLRATHNLALLAAFVVAAAAIHAGIVAAYANPIPYSDEWIALIDNVLRPWASGQFSLLDLFKSHNEHTIVPTRLLGLILLWLNHGQFDNVPSALLNALFYAAAWAVPIHLFFRHASGTLQTFAVVMGLAALAPLEGEDLIFGFQNQYYFLIAGSVATLWLATTACSTSKRSLAAFAVVAFATCVSMGSGFFASALAVVVCALRWQHEPQHRRALKLRMLIGLAIAVFGLILLLHSFVVMKQQGILGNKQIDLDGIRRVFSCLAWPYTSAAWAGVLLALPFGAFSLRLLWRRESATALDYLAFGIGLWAGAQACALAFDRHSEATSLASRYLPVLLFWPLMNVYAVNRLVGVATSGRVTRSAAILSLLPAVAAGALIANTVKMAPASLSAVAVASQQHQMQAAHVARYVRIGDSDALNKAGHMGLPYPNTQKLQSLLDDPAVRHGLPANVRPALVVKSEPAETPPAFVPQGAYESVPRRDDLPGFGSHSAAGDAAVGRFRSEPLDTQFPYVRLDLAGYLPEAGLSLRLECADNPDCRASDVLPFEQARESWRGIYVRVPQTHFRIAADDSSKTRWLAFTAPVEVGRLSVLSDAFVNRLRVDANIWISLVCGVLALLLLVGIWRDPPVLPAANEN